MLTEYNFSRGTRGKYAKRYAQGSNIVVIEPDVHKYFSTQKSVNEALRGLAKVKKYGAKPPGVLVITGRPPIDENGQ
jgi:hypothetical protein